MVMRKRLLGKNIGGYLEVAGLCGGDKCFEVDHTGSAHEHEEATGADQGKLSRTEKALIFGSHARENKNGVRRREQLIKRGWRAVIVEDLSLRQPRIVNFDCTAEWPQQR